MKKSGFNWAMLLAITVLFFAASQYKEEGSILPAVQGKYTKRTYTKTYTYTKKKSYGYKDYSRYSYNRYSYYRYYRYGGYGGGGVVIIGGGFGGCILCCVLPCIIWWCCCQTGRRPICGSFSSMGRSRSSHSSGYVREHHTVQVVEHTTVEEVDNKPGMPGQYPGGFQQNQ